MVQKDGMKGIYVEYICRVTIFFAIFLIISITAGNNYVKER